MAKDINAKDDSLEFVLAGSFEPRLTLPAVEELNQRKIACRLKEISFYSTSLYVLKHSPSEAGKILDRIKKSTEG
jgi:hypothetical protein